MTGPSFRQPRTISIQEGLHCKLYLASPGGVHAMERSGILEAFARRGDERVSWFQDLNIALKNCPNPARKISKEGGGWKQMR